MWGIYINIGGYSKVVVVLVVMKENWRCGVCLHKYRSDRIVDLNQSLTMIYRFGCIGGVVVEM